MGRMNSTNKHSGKEDDDGEGREKVQHQRQGEKKKKKKSVWFATNHSVNAVDDDDIPMTLVIPIPRVEDMSQLERESTWYTVKEYLSMKHNNDIQLEEFNKIFPPSSTPSSPPSPTTKKPVKFSKSKKNIASSPKPTQKQKRREAARQEQPQPRTNHVTRIQRSCRIDACGMIITNTTKTVMMKKEITPSSSSSSINNSNSYATMIDDEEAEKTMVDDNEETYRGLEWKSERTGKHRKAALKRAIHAVLHEQTRQQSSGTRRNMKTKDDDDDDDNNDDEDGAELLAIIYRGYCISSAQTAMRQAKVDYQEALQVYQEKEKDQSITKTTTTSKEKRRKDDHQDYQYIPQRKKTIVTKTSLMNRDEQSDSFDDDDIDIDTDEDYEDMFDSSCYTSTTSTTTSIDEDDEYDQDHDVDNSESFSVSTEQTVQSKQSKLREKNRILSFTPPSRSVSLTSTSSSEESFPGIFLRNQFNRIRRLGSNGSFNGNKNNNGSNNNNNGERRHNFIGWTKMDNNNNRFSKNKNKTYPTEDGDDDNNNNKDDVPRSDRLDVKRYGLEQAAVTMMATSTNEGGKRKRQTTTGPNSRTLEATNTISASTDDGMLLGRSFFPSPPGRTSSRKLRALRTISTSFQKPPTKKPERRQRQQPPAAAPTIP